MSALLAEALLRTCLAGGLVRRRQRQRGGAEQPDGQQRDARGHHDGREPGAQRHGPAVSPGCPARCPAVSGAHALVRRSGPRGCLLGAETRLLHRESHQGYGCIL